MRLMKLWRHYCFPTPPKASPFRRAHSRPRTLATSHRPRPTTLSCRRCSSRPSCRPTGVSRCAARAVLAPLCPARGEWLEEADTRARDRGVVSTRRCCSALASPPRHHSRTPAAANPEPAKPPVAAQPAATKQPAAAGQSAAVKEAAAAPPAAYAVHAPHGGAGHVVVEAHNTSEFPSLGDTSVVGRIGGPAANGLQNVNVNQISPAASNLNPATAQAFVPVPKPAAQPRRFSADTFKNGMIFKANDQTYGECLRRQLFGLPANQMDRAVRSISVGETALFLYNFRASFPVCRCRLLRALALLALLTSSMCTWLCVIFPHPAVKGAAGRLRSNRAPKNEHRARCLETIWAPLARRELAVPSAGDGRAPLCLAPRWRYACRFPSFPSSLLPSPLPSSLLSVSLPPPLPFVPSLRRGCVCLRPLLPLFPSSFPCHSSLFSLAPPPPPILRFPFLFFLLLFSLLSPPLPLFLPLLSPFPFLFPLFLFLLCARACAFFGPDMVAGEGEI
jgi:hypothetical protein